MIRSDLNGATYEKQPVTLLPSTVVYLTLDLEGLHEICVALMRLRLCYSCAHLAFTGNYCHKKYFANNSRPVRSICIHLTEATTRTISADKLENTVKGTSICNRLRYNNIKCYTSGESPKI
ncbi:uncharacterized protein LOC112212172 [Bombus impatiens]|uniref:Uncharacterized protein LOC112212172 n=1 Tax=Bombus impatiens TaxID=132113 RepID=A0A6P8LHT1_BOMIM|nr:uncharacterized protein LOC112212172 [Bombus impatiens]